MQGRDQNKTPTTNYNVSPDRIFDEARRADTIMVIGLKDGLPHLWSNKNEDKAQELLAQFFPEAVLPEREGAQVG